MCVRISTVELSADDERQVALMEWLAEQEVGRAFARQHVLGMTGHEHDSRDREALVRGR
jgi:hypothetical protein